MVSTGTVQIDMPLGVVLRRTPGVTRWAKWHWRAVAVLPGAGPANWKELRRDGESVEYHVATLPLTLYASDTEAYLTNISDTVPSVYVILRNEKDGEAPLKAFTVTASPFEAQDYADNGEDIVEKVAMSEGLIAWVGAFLAEHHREETFVKRRRDRLRTDRREDGIGDPRIRQTADVYRAPRRAVP